MLYYFLRVYEPIKNYLLKEEAIMALEDYAAKIAAIAPVQKAIHRVVATTEYFIFPLLIPFQDIIEGPGSSERAVELLKNNGNKKALIITDAVLVKLGILKAMLKAMDKAKFEYAIFDGVEPNPSIENIEAGFALYQKEKCDCIVGFGGGSAMDCSKVVACRAAKPNMSVLDMCRAMGYFPVTLPKLDKTPFLLAVPTTAGTGAESTVAAVVSNHSIDKKVTITDIAMRPNAVILDASLATGLPPKSTAETAIDAFCHCLEGYINLSHNPRADEYAIRGMRLIMENIDTAFNDGKNLEARQNLCQAAYFGGQVLNFEMTGYVHPFCHKIGAKYGLVHGRCIGAVLPIMLEAYGKDVESRLAKVACALGLAEKGDSPVNQAKTLIAWIREFDTKYGIPANIPEISEDDFEEIADSIMLEMFPYPTKTYFTRNEIYSLLRKIKGNN